MITNVYTVKFFADVFLHEISHSIDAMTPVAILPLNMGQEMREIKAYGFARSWTGVNRDPDVRGYQNILLNKALQLSSYLRK